MRPAELPGKRKGPSWSPSPFTSALHHLRGGGAGSGPWGLKGTSLGTWAYPLPTAVPSLDSGAEGCSPVEDVPGWLGRVSPLQAEQARGYTDSELRLLRCYLVMTSLWALFCYLQSPCTAPISSDPHQNPGRKKRHWAWSWKTRGQVLTSAISLSLSHSANVHNAATVCRALY